MPILQTTRENQEIWREKTGLLFAAAFRKGIIAALAQDHQRMGCEEWEANRRAMRDYEKLFTERVKKAPML